MTIYILKTDVLGDSSSKKIPFNFKEFSRSVTKLVGNLREKLKLDVHYSREKIDITTSLSPP